MEPDSQTRPQPPSAAAVAVAAVLTAAAPGRAARQRHDLTGRRYGMLVAEHLVPKQPGTQGEAWFCVCDCGGSRGWGGSTIARVKDLNSGNTTSCGCKANRPRREPGTPHRAGDGDGLLCPGALYLEVRGAAESALRDRAEPVAAVRGAFAGRTSRSTLYRFIRRALAEIAAAEHSNLVPAGALRAQCLDPVLQVTDVPAAGDAPQAPTDGA